MNLPVKYSKLSREDRISVRLAYVILQKYKCYYCKNDLNGKPTQEILNKSIDLRKFPKNFLKYPVHLHHDHKTDLTIGAVHAYCNAVLWQYEKE